MHFEPSAQSQHAAVLVENHLHHHPWRLVMGVRVAYLVPVTDIHSRYICALVNGSMLLACEKSGETVRILKSISVELRPAASKARPKNGRLRRQAICQHGRWQIPNTYLSLRQARAAVVEWAQRRVGARLRQSPRGY